MTNLHLNTFFFKWPKNLNQRWINAKTLECKELVTQGPLVVFLSICNINMNKTWRQPRATAWCFMSQWRQNSVNVSDFSLFHSLCIPCECRNKPRMASFWSLFLGRSTSSGSAALRDCVGRQSFQEMSDPKSKELMLSLFFCWCVPH